MIRPIPPDTRKAVFINSYKWDEAAQRYITMPNETKKYYRWNRITQEYEEVEI
jgi:hypothetical protein